MRLAGFNGEGEDRSGSGEGGGVGERARGQKRGRKERLEGGHGGHMVGTWGTWSIWDRYKDLEKYHWLKTKARFQKTGILNAKIWFLTNN